MVLLLFERFLIFDILVPGPDKFCWNNLVRPFDILINSAIPSCFWQYKTILSFDANPKPNLIIFSVFLSQGVLSTWSGSD